MTNTANPYLTKTKETNYPLNALKDNCLNIPYCFMEKQEVIEGAILDGASKAELLTIVSEGEYTEAFETVERRRNYFEALSEEDKAEEVTASLTWEVK
ncbi:MAG: hypothetical protein M3367_02840 [Acidobacteriota bacterium]|nr:hypothetical protein [Acidobacteriota bacterium]